MYTDIKTLSDEALKAIKASIDAELKDRTEKTFEKDKKNLIKSIENFMYKYPNAEIFANDTMTDVVLTPYLTGHYSLKIKLKAE